MLQGYMCVRNMAKINVKLTLLVVAVSSTLVACGSVHKKFHKKSWFGSCDLDQWECMNHDCIYSKWRCDGDTDCLDGSDERNCECASNEFRCDNNDCILGMFQCDGDDDCGDGSDEANCATCYFEYEFQCDNTNCVYNGFVCDGDDDCGDNSDEQNCGPMTEEPQVPEQYQFVSEKMTQEEARASCSNNGRTLLQIDSLEKQQEVEQFLSAYNVDDYVWTDGRRENDCNVRFFWVTSGLPVRFTYWRLDACQPDNYMGRENCIHLVPEANFQWNDIECTERYYSICEITSEVK